MIGTLSQGSKGTFTPFEVRRLRLFTVHRPTRIFDSIPGRL